MFESTLEAQGLSVGERRLGTLSAAALAHLAIGLGIAAAAAFFVPKVTTPEPPMDPVRIIAVIPKAEETPRPAPAPAPRRGTDNPGPTRPLTPPPDVPDAPPTMTPDSLPDPPVETPVEGKDGDGEGPLGEANGSERGVPGGTGLTDGGSEGGGGGDGPVPVTGDMVRPVLVEKVAPAYPDIARIARLSGRVVVNAVIAPDGTVESVEVISSSNPMFNEAAVGAVRQWRYRPALMNGKPVRVYFSVVVEFRLR